MGQFLFEHDTDGTFVGMTGVGAKIGGQTVLTEGEGAFAIYTDGVAGFISGKAQLTGYGVNVGGKILLRVNTTGHAVDRTLTVGGRDLLIRFGESEGNVFAVSISNASININDTVFVEGSVSFDSSGHFAGSGLLVFVGDGPYSLANGDINPLARGVVLHDATIGVVKTGADYALDARGTIELVGFDDVTVGGTVRVRANTFAGAIDQTLTIPGTDLEVPWSSRPTRRATPRRTLRSSPLRASASRSSSSARSSPATLPSRRTPTASASSRATSSSRSATRDRTSAPAGRRSSN